MRRNWIDWVTHTCIIGRDQMDLSGACKKLPICGHAYKFYAVLLLSIVTESTYEHHYFQSTHIV
jgi:hypothetical protein